MRLGLAKASCCLLLGLAVLLIMAIGASAQIASPWVEGMNSRARLVAATLPSAAALPGSDAATTLAGFEIEMAKGWKTYWRSPGDSGIPPRFDWTGSENLASAEILFPAPARFDDGVGGYSIGYKDGVVLPIAIVASDPSRPVRLRAFVEFAVCDVLCIPTDATVALDVPAGAKMDSWAPLLASVETLPVPLAAGEPGPHKLVGVEVDESADPKLLRVQVRHSEKADPKADLFVEGPAEWYLPLPTEVSRNSDDAGITITYEVLLDALPKDAVVAGTELRFTVVSSNGSIEQGWVL